MMKKLILSILLLAFSVCIFAQTQLEEPKAIADRLIEKYQLDKDQPAKMIQIQERHLRNFQSIQNLEETNPALFRQKRRTMLNGTYGSVKLLLNEDQLKLYYADQGDKRILRAAKMTELKESGATVEEMQEAFLEIDEKQ